MEAGQEIQEDISYGEEVNQGSAQPEEIKQENEQEESVVAEETQQRNSRLNNHEDRSSFIHGLAVGLGIGCIATFVIMWITVFFSPQLPSTATYEVMLTIFIYPLLYLLAVGLVALTAGIVREYYSIKGKL